MDNYCSMDGEEILIWGINSTVHLAVLLADSPFFIPSNANLSLNTNDEKSCTLSLEEDFVYEKLRNSRGPKEHFYHECTRCMPNGGCHTCIIRLFSWTYASCKVIFKRKSTTTSTAISCKTGTSKFDCRVFDILIWFTFKLEIVRTIIIRLIIFWLWTGWLELIYCKHESCTSSNLCFNILHLLEVPTVYEDTIICAKNAISPVLSLQKTVLWKYQLL